MPRVPSIMEKTWSKAREEGGGDTARGWWGRCGRREEEWTMRGMNDGGGYGRLGGMNDGGGYGRWEGIDDEGKVWTMRG